MIQEITQENE